uniref:Cupin domain containing protein n=1 Tax=Streptomyces candidus TaxID=67283 RepID=A0A5J6DEV2_9ACTN|nr:Cupin domain containing protein [Streptomyces candidus]QER90994.1 pyfR [Streptomyces candidus]
MFIDWEKMPRTRSPRAKDSRRIASGQNMSFVRIEIEPTAEFTGETHWHMHEQWVVVLAGDVRMTVADEEVQLTTGDVLYIPIDAPHAPLAVGPAGATYLEIFAPPRMDLLPESIVPAV